MTHGSKLATLALAAAAATLAAPAAMAIDISPGDYTVMPEGTWAALEYFQYADSNSLHVNGVGSVPDSSVDALVATSRLVYYGKAGDLSYGLQAFIPVGTFTDATIAGNPVHKANGAGDLTFGAGAWFIEPNDPATGTTLGMSLFLSTPTGNHDATGVGFGTGTWTLTPQLGLIQGLGNGFMFDAALDVALTRDHNEDGIRYGRRPSWQVQTYLRYQPSPLTSVSFGYSGKFGGELSADGVATGTQTRVDSLRLFASHFITPQMQIEGMISKDIHVEGGTKGSAVQLRLLRLF